MILSFSSGVNKLDRDLDKINSTSLVNICKHCSSVIIKDYTCMGWVCIEALDM